MPVGMRRTPLGPIFSTDSQTALPGAERRDASRRHRTRHARCRERHSRQGSVWAAAIEHLKALHVTGLAPEANTVDVVDVKEIGLNICSVVPVQR